MELFYHKFIEYIGNIILTLLLRLPHYILGQYLRKLKY